MLWIIASTLVIGYAACLLFLFLSQSKLLYHPYKELDGSPKDLGLAYESVSFRAADGPLIDAWLVPASTPKKGVILFCHGNAGNISHCLSVINTLHNLDLSVLIFDYRGFGRSEGSPSESGTYNDARAAWDYLVSTRGVAPGRIVIYGWSLGGAVAARLAATLPPDQQPAAVVIASAFSSLGDMAAHHYPLFPTRLLLRFDYPTAADAARIRRPTLVIHSVDDEIVPFAQGRRIFDAITAEKLFLQASGGHNEDFEFSSRGDRDTLRQFIHARLPPETAAGAAGL